MTEILESKVKTNVGPSIPSDVYSPDLCCPLSAETHGLKLPATNFPVGSEGPAEVQPCLMMQLPSGMEPDRSCMGEMVSVVFRAQPSSDLPQCGDSGGSS